MCLLISRTFAVRPVSNKDSFFLSTFSLVIFQVSPVFNKHCTLFHRVQPSFCRIALSKVLFYISIFFFPVQKNQSKYLLNKGQNLFLSTFNVRSMDFFSFRFSNMKFQAIIWYASESFVFQFPSLQLRYWFNNRWRYTHHKDRKG